MDSNTNAPINNIFDFFSAANDKYVNEILGKDIIELLGLQNASDEEKADIYNKMMETIHNRVMSKMTEILTEEQFTELKECLKSNDESRFEKFIQEAGIDVAALYSEQALLYKVEIVNLLNASKNQKEE